MNNLYVVESPLQALCAVEVALGCSADRNYLIIKLGDESRSKSNEQLLNVSKIYDWHKVIILKHSKTTSAILFHFAYLRDLNYIMLRFRTKIDNLYIGEFRYPFMHHIRNAVRAKKTYLLDDGAATINVINKYISKGIFYPENIFLYEKTLKQRVLKLFYLNFIRKDNLEKNITALTAFADTNKTLKNVENIRFQKIKNLANMKQQVDYSKVFFYGSYYSERGYVSKDYEFRFLASIKEFYNLRDMEVTYFAHRDESADKLDYLSNQLGFIVKSPSDLAELYLLKANTLPGEIAGIYTSTLNNIRYIYPSIVLRSFKFDEKEIDFGRRNIINDVYEHYHKIGILIEPISVKP